jgi:predicted metalloendopeptidase
MDDKTKARAEDKLNRMKERIGYPDEILSKDLVEDYHKDLVITEEDYLENQIRMILWSRKKALSKLREPVDKDLWTDRASVRIFSRVSCHDCYLVTLAVKNLS